MPDTLPRTVTRRFLSSLKTGAVVHRDRDGVAWGWFSSPVPRLHLVPVDNALQGQALVWLEDATGVRSFQADPLYTGISIDLNALRASVARTRDTVERAWLLTSERKGWLDYSPRDAVITMYRGTPQERTVYVRDNAHRPEFLQIDVATNSACLEIRLNRLIWRGADDGSDAMEMATPGRTRA